MQADERRMGYFPGRSNYREYAVLALGALIAIATFSQRLRFPFDDAFITFRYAEHLAQGYGLRWNVGGPPTEGYTNFLYVVILAGLRLVTSNLLLASQLLNIVCTLLSAVLILRLAALLAHDDAHRSSILLLAAPVLFYITPTTWANCYSAMETPLFVFLILAALYAFGLFLELEHKHQINLGFVLCFLSLLTRPEGGLLAVVIFVLALHHKRQQHGSQREVVLAFTFYWLIPLALYLLWKYWYFGTILPNSFLVKVVLEQGGGHAKFFRGLQYIRIFLTGSAAVLVASAIGPLRKMAILRTAILIWFALLCGFYLFPEPLMGFYDRFVVAAEAPLFAAAVAGILYWLRTKSIYLVGGVLIIFIGLHFTIAAISPRGHEAFSASQNIPNGRYEEIASVLRSFPNPQELQLVFSDAGLIPYRSGMKNIDPVGLNTNSIARAHSSEEIQTLLRNETPDLFLIPIDHSFGERDTCRTILRDTHGRAGETFLGFIHSDLYNQYEFVALFRAPIYDLALLVRRNLQSFPTIEERIQAARNAQPQLFGITPRCLN